ncbi:MAG TPA: hypothetical protein VIK52_09945 [Opitutaceae bacterium]
MKTEHVPYGRNIPVFSRRHSRAFFLTIAILVILHPERALHAQGQSAKTGGGELISLDFAKAPLGAPPTELRVLRGKLDVVEKDGVHMLRSSEDATFLVSVPEKIPNRFALEFDLVPKFSGETNTAELSFEGTREVSHSEDSAHVAWSHHKISVIGGGQAYAGGQVDLPEDLKEEVIGNLTKIRAEFDGSNLTVHTNGRTVFESKTAKFNRGRILRVSLGGTDEDESAVYLASMRMIALDGSGGSTAQQQSGLTSTRATETQTPSGGTGAASNEMAPTSTDTHTASPASGSSLAITGITVTVDAAGVATVTWNPLSVATTYQVMRWNAGDPSCCNNMSPPGMPLQNAVWQDGVLPVAGTYAYRVIARTSDGFIAGETQISYRGTATPPAGVATTTMPTVTAPTIATEPVTTTSSTYMTPGRLAAIAPPPGETTEDASVSTFSPPLSPDVGTLEESVPSSGDTTSGGGTAPSGTVVTAEPAPYSSEPRTVSVMETEPAQTTSEPEPVGVITTMEPTFATGMLSPAPAITDPTLMQTASTDTSGGGGAATASGRYRIIIAGLSVGVVTKDDILNLDGMGNEVYAAAAVVNWNRQTSQLNDFTFVQTRDFGDIANGTIFGDRIKAGSASMTTGGLTAGDRAPSGFDLKANTLPAPTGDQLPLLVWEGTLTAGAEAILISPSVWEHDVSRTQFTLYKQNWGKSSPSAIMSSSVVSDQFSSATISSPVAPISQLVVAAPPAPTFIGLPSDSYKMAILIFPPGEDRPIGLGQAGPGVVTYQDRLVVITQEKLASLNVGDGTMISLLYAEPIDLFLAGQYTLYVRIERTE